MILEPLVILDTETTGSSAAYERIIEIALVRFEEGVEVSRWQSLVNPGIPISPFITSLTGITNDMVRDAPAFEDIAADLYGYLEGATLAAHNAKFDYGFLKAEYGRIGAVLRLKLLCTVRLSRKLYPHHKGHGLDAIMRRHGLTTNHRHRAMGDVELVIDYWKLAVRDLGPGLVWDAINELTKGPKLPPGLDADFLDKIPEGPGVYIFYGDTSLPLYIGKSVTLRARVLSHFSSDHASTKEMAIVQEVKRVEWIETAGELGALLLESKLIKEMQPAYNRMLRYSRKLFSFRLAQGLNETPLVKLVTDDDIHPGIFDYLYGMFKTKKGAMDTLRKLATEHNLCIRALGIETGKGACFAYQLKRCKGVCAGKESPELHFLRLKMALTGLRLKSWPYAGKVGIREINQANNLTQIHVFDQWCYIGSAEDEIGLEELTQLHRAAMCFDLDNYKMIKKTFEKDIELLYI